MGGAGSPVAPLPQLPPPPPCSRTPVAPLQQILMKGPETNTRVSGPRNPHLGALPTRRSLLPCPNTPLGYDSVSIPEIRVLISDGLALARPTLGHHVGVVQ